MCVAHGLCDVTQHGLVCQHVVGLIIVTEPVQGDFRKFGRLCFGFFDEHLARCLVVDRRDARLEVHGAQFFPFWAAPGQRVHQADQEARAAGDRHAVHVEAFLAHLVNFINEHLTGTVGASGRNAEEHTVSTRDGLLANQFDLTFELARQVQDVLHEPTARALYRFCDGDEFFVFGVGSRDIASIGQTVADDARSRKADRAGCDRFGNDFGHPCDFGFAGLLVDAAFAHHVKANRAVAHHAANIDGRLHGFECVEVAAVTFPIPGQAIQNRVSRNVFNRFHHVGEGLGVARAYGSERDAAVTEKRRGDAMP